MSPQWSKDIGTLHWHYVGVIISKFTDILNICSTVWPGCHQKIHQLPLFALVRRIHQWLMDSPHKGPELGKAFHIIVSSWDECHCSCLILDRDKRPHIFVPCCILACSECHMPGKFYICTNDWTFYNQVLHTGGQYSVLNPCNGCVPWTKAGDLSKDQPRRG